MCLSTQNLDPLQTSQNTEPTIAQLQQQTVALRTTLQEQVSFIQTLQNADGWPPYTAKKYAYVIHMQNSS